MQKEIFIKGARENNLKNIDVTIPRDKLVVLTGLSGSGKSSLAFDTIYAEGQRRYVESLSSVSYTHLDVYKRQLYAGASTIILAHNHPSGVALPSDADVLVTRRIQEALAPLGIRLADHIIVADDDYVSMAESGFLQR